MTTTIELDLNPIKEDIKANFQLGDRKYEVSLYALWEKHSKLDTGPDENLEQFKSEIKVLYEDVFNASTYTTDGPEVSSEEETVGKAQLTPEQCFVIYTTVCNHVGNLFKKK